MHRSIRHALLVVVTFILIAPAAPRPAQAAPQRPSLILVISIDQFRADFLTRFEKRFLPARTKSGDVGGFEYLMSQGAYYPFGQYDILHSMTGPGHATILSGAYPYISGISLNYWFDYDTLKPTYCVDDPSAESVGAPGVSVSPKNFFADTVGDELKNAGYPSRVVGIALKDRAAILMAGHRADLALWYEPKAMQWVSSKHYLPQGKLPDWALKLNEGLKNHEGEKIHWDVASPGSGFSNETQKPGEKSVSHTADYGDKASLLMPFGLEITETAAEAAIDAMKLGQGKGTDVLAVSFSSHDYVGHKYGPNSRESEEMTVAEDLLISQLLNHVRDRIPGGLKNAVVVLTADHGAPSDADWLKANHMEAGRVDDRALGKEISAKLNEKYGAPSKGEWIPFAHDSNYFINRKAAAEKKIDPAQIEAEIKQHLLQVPGIAHVFTRSDYLARKLPPGMHERQILHTYFPGRSGDVVVIYRPQYSTTDTGDKVSHGTGYAYDRTVPIILFGPNYFRAGHYAQRAEVVDIAPTLAWISGSMPPNASEGRVLSEALLPVKR